MKKIYFAPQTEMLECMTEEMIAGSVVGDETFDIGYGGLDDKGELDPESRIPFGNFIFGE